MRRIAAGAVLVAVPPAVAVPALASAERAARRGDVPDAPAVAVPTARLATPLLSARRVPGLAAGADPASVLRQRLGALDAEVNDTSCLAVSVAGAPVHAVHADTPLVPASNQKLVTAAVAIEVLGADFRFRTAAFAIGLPDAAGTLAGDLHLVGGGDPLLSTEPYRVARAADPADAGVARTSLEALADAVVAAGVRAVAGAVVGDDGRYDRVYFVPRWGNRFRDSAGPASALAVNEGLARLAPRALAADPAATAAATFASLLAARGVTVGGGSRAGSTPRDASPLGSVSSVPLADVIHEVLARSDNTGAELLLKEIGLVARSEGSAAAGAAAATEKLAAWMAEAGVAVDGVVVADGSGLSADNRLTCNVLLALMERHGADSPVVRGLPVAATHGTLVDNLAGTVAAGRLRAKTGSLQSQDTRSLTGVWPTDDGELVRFASVLRRAGIAATDDRADPYWTALAEAFATYPYRPDLTPFGPRSPLG